MRKIFFALSVFTLALFSSCKRDKVLTTFDPNCVDTVGFNATVLPMITQYCTGCHDTGNSTGYTINNHTNILTNATAILNAMRGQGGMQLMPDGGPALPDSLIQDFNCWINQGKLNN